MKRIENTFDSCMEVAKLTSPAKLNVGLHIVGRRNDGYHELESVFWPITFADEIVLRPASQIEVTISWSENAPVPATLLPQSRENLVFRVLEEYQQISGKAYQAEISKRIPIGGGLGGGSSNAGTVLRHLVQKDPAFSAQVKRVALKAGADTPFFLTARPAWVSGIGESIVPLTLKQIPELHFLLVCLPKPTPTSKIFDAFRKEGAFVKRMSHCIGTAEDLMRWVASASNSLESFAAREYPLVTEVLEQLRTTVALHVALSGSGSTCFAIFSQRAARSAAANELEPFFRQVGCRSVEADTFNM